MKCCGLSIGLAALKRETTNKPESKVRLNCLTPDQSTETMSLQERSSEHGPSSETGLPLSCKSASTRSSENGRSSERNTVVGKTVIGKRQSSPPTQSLSKRRRKNTNISSRQIQLEQSKQQSLFDSKCDGSKGPNNLRPSQAGSNPGVCKKGLVLIHTFVFSFIITIVHLFTSTGNKLNRNK